MNGTEGAPNNKQPAAAARPPRPPRTEVTPDHIPAQLKNTPQWVLWKYELNQAKDKWGKVPYQAKHPTRKASSTRPNTWSDYQAAITAYQDGKSDGIGFVFNENDTFTGIDFDDKINTSTGEIDPATTSTIEVLNSYTELSPSGTGYHVILQGKPPSKTGRKNDQLGIEIYSHARFFTITGHTTHNASGVEERQEELNWLHKEVFPAEPTPEQPPAKPLNLSEDEIIRSAQRAKNNTKFNRLHQGDLSDYINPTTGNPDRSRADLAYVGFLRFHGATPEQQDSIYRKSPLYRPKWDEDRGAGTYGQITINETLSGPVKAAPTRERITFGSPAAPPAYVAEPEQPTEVDEHNYAHLSIDASRYAINETGIYPVKLAKVDGDWVEITDYKNPIAGRPIWPTAIGHDVTRNNQTHIKLAWRDPKGNTRTQWVNHAQINERQTLLGLNGAPVSYGRFAALTNWLADATSWITTPAKTLITRPHWHDGKYLLPRSTSTAEYIGLERTTTGTPEAWAEALTELLNLPGTASYPALVALGFSAASPLVKLIDKRRPIVLFAYSSSSGKGVIINLGLSIWDNPSTLTSPEGSTWKGIQDTAIQNPDMPVFLDEFQQLAKRAHHILESILYFFGNGKSRVLSSPDQTTRGGDPRNGVAFIAAEEDILQNRQGGSQNRTVRIEQAPLPEKSAALAAKLERITKANHGALAPVIVGLINEDPERLALAIEAYAIKLRAGHPDLKGDDHVHLSIMRTGLHLLATATGHHLPVNEVTTWLARMLASQRDETVDRETAALRDLLQTVAGHQWVEPGSFPGSPIASDCLQTHNEFVAFRGEAATGFTSLEINPKAALTLKVLQKHDLHEPSGEWARRGWIKTPGSGRHLTFQKKYRSQRAGRVWRFTDEALLVAGISVEDPESDA